MIEQHHSKRAGWMNQADRIREFVTDAYVRPALAGDLNEIEVRAGDVHRAMSLTNALPAICSALGGSKFEQHADVRIIDRTGPLNGANAYFRFRLTSERATITEQAKSPTSPNRRSKEKISRQSVPTASFTVTLVSCVKSKLPHKATAKELYTSAQFRGARRFAEVTGGRWYVLSALYGLVEPDAIINPYDRTLKMLPIEQRRAWAQETFDALMQAEPGLLNVIILAGQRYREFLVPKLLHHGLNVDVPMAHLRQGEQLAWLAGNYGAAR